MLNNKFNVSCSMIISFTLYNEHIFLRFKIDYGVILQLPNIIKVVDSEQKTRTENIALVIAIATSCFQFLIATTLIISVGLSWMTTSLKESCKHILPPGHTFWQTHASNMSTCIRLFLLSLRLTFDQNRILGWSTECQYQKCC